VNPEKELRFLLNYRSLRRSNFERLYIERMTSNEIILIVDDERSILTVLDHQINSFFGNRFTLEFANSANEAFEVYKELLATGNTVSLVITDQMMPGMKGNELIEKLKALTPELHTVLLTGYADTKVMSELLEKKDITCIDKPWEKSEITDLIDQLLA
jgi:CheY-like chemotaxis protein